MKTLMAICLLLLALTSNAETRSFEKEISSILSTGQVADYGDWNQITWTDIKIDGYLVVALLEEELEELTRSELDELAQERADQICQWVGFEYAVSFEMAGGHHVYKRENYWYSLRSTIGSYPSRDDLRPVRIAPNTSYLATSAITSMLKINTSRDVVLRKSSPKSFSIITCAR